MKIAAFSCREDEIGYFEGYGKQYGIDLVWTSNAPGLDNAKLVEGCQAVSVITTPIAEDLIRVWHKYGIKVISTRTVGYEHIHYQLAASLGITVSNVSYSAHTVAEYTVMCILMAIRRMKTIMTRYIGQDYSLKQVRGRELCHMTIGVIGTGQIGENVIANLSGFGCKILAYDPYPKETVKKYAEYVSLDRLWSASDLITLHAPATEETYHLIDEETLKQMKDGVILINAARGSLIHTTALIAALESGKVGAAALDVLEEEGKIYYKDFKYAATGHHEMAILQAMPQVLMTPHTAFFTDEAVSDMIEYSISSCLKTLTGENNPWKIN